VAEIQSVRPGDCIISSLTINSRFGGTNFSVVGQVSQINIYEDIGKPFVYAEFMMLDALGLVQSIPIIGQETINLTIRTPGRLNSSRTLSLLTYSIESVIQNDHADMAVYKIKAVSPSILINSAIYISKSYEDTISNIVKDIIKSYLHYQGPTFIEQTKGTQLITLPRTRPYQAIDLVRNRAVSLKNKSSVFVFFENYKGLFFATLEELVMNNKIGNRNFTYYGTADDSEHGQDFRSIIEYVNDQRFDIVKKTSMSGIQSSSFRFDFITKTIQPTEKIYNGENIGLGGGLPTNTGELYGSIGKLSNTLPQHFVVHDSNKPETFISETKPIRDLYRGNIENITTIMVHGDSSITAGEKVNINVIKPEGSSAADKPDLVAGNYLIAKSRHQITMGERPKHVISLQLLKDDYLKVK
jgi:hypothetical protein